MCVLQAPGTDDDDIVMVDAHRNDNRLSALVTGPVEAKVKISATNRRQRPRKVRMKKKRNVHVKADEVERGLLSTSEITEEGDMEENLEDAKVNVAEENVEGYGGREWREEAQYKYQNGAPPQKIRLLKRKAATPDQPLGKRVNSRSNGSDSSSSSSSKAQRYMLRGTTSTQAFVASPSSRWRSSSASADKTQKPVQQRITEDLPDCNSTKAPAATVIP